LRLGIFWILCQQTLSSISYGLLHVCGEEVESTNHHHPNHTCTLPTRKMQNMQWNRHRHPRPANRQMQEMSRHRATPVPKGISRKMPQLPRQRKNLPPKPKWNRMRGMRWIRRSQNPIGTSGHCSKKECSSAEPSSNHQTQSPLKLYLK
jgi:hypothetical protein